MERQRQRGIERLKNEWIEGGREGGGGINAWSDRGKGRNERMDEQMNRWTNRQFIHIDIFFG